MKIAVINFSGNVGKSTLARHLLLPRIKGADLIRVESINADEYAAKTVRGTQFGEISEHLLEVENAVVDVGASNVESFTDLMRQYEGSQEDFDCFVVPVVKAAKQLRDSIATVEALGAMGIEAKRVQVVFNQVHHDEDAEALFAPLYDWNADNHGCTIAPGACVYYSELYQRLRELGASIEELLNDKTDLRARLRETKDANEKNRIITRISAGRLARSASKNLDQVFMAITQP